MTDLKPWPPSARHHHGFLRTVIFFPDSVQQCAYTEPWIIAYVDGQRMAGRRDLVDLEHQRRDEWMEFYEAREEELKGHPCKMPFKCIWTAFYEVLALAVEEGVDTSIVTGTPLVALSE